VVNFLASDNPARTQIASGVDLLVLKKDRNNGSYVTNDLSKNMLPLFYQTHLQQHLTRAQFLVLGILLNLLQSSRQVKLDRLASAFPYPITTPLSASEITEVIEFGSTNNQSDLVSLHHLLVNYLFPSGSDFINCDRSHLAGVISIYSWFAWCAIRELPLYSGHCYLS
jgi:hypothetical protein